MSQKIAKIMIRIFEFPRIYIEGSKEMNFRNFKERIIYARLVWRFMISQ